MTIENLYPFAGDHAVKNATFVLEWADPLTEAHIVEASKLGSKFKNLGLGVHTLRHRLEVKLEANATSGAQKTSPGMMTFSKAEQPTDEMRSVSITREGCVINVPDYSRWAEVFAEVEKYLKIVLDEFGPLRPVKGVGLQYVDFFSWKDDPSELDLSSVFQRDSYIPPHALTQTGLWHSHHGFLQAFELPLKHNRLENVNVDMADVGGIRVIQVTGSLQVTLNEVLWQAHLKNKQKITDIFEALHLANKTMLSKLFTKEVCDKIKLTVN